MVYFLFLNHPKDEKIYRVSTEKEERARKYFSGKNTIESSVVIRGKEYRALIDYEVFANECNFDCFNCEDTCCGDSPAKFEEKTREFILDNIDEYNSLTWNLDILHELGYETEDIEESIRDDDVMIPEEHVGEEIALCTCAFKPKNGTTLCAIHSICMKKEMGAEEIVGLKPEVCNLWPIEILAEDDLSMLYITLPDDFTNSFTIEDYYNKACINIDYGVSPAFKRTNPEGFHEEGYKPLIISYGDTIRYSLGERCYDDIKRKLLEEELVSIEDFEDEEQQINKKY